MARQIPLDLPVIEATGRDDFFVCATNLAATRLIDDWPGWPEARLLLTGPKGSGKSHLASVWAVETGAETAHSVTPPPVPSTPLVLEDIHRFMGNPEAEEALFHTLNRFAAPGTPLLMTAQEPLTPTLPDLATRLAATTRASLGEPDDELLMALLLKHFTDRQLDPSSELLSYLVTRMERSAQAAQALVAALDRHQLATGHRLSRGLAAEVLEQPEFSGN